MDLLILGESLGHPLYRGTERTRPYYVDSLPESHPVNQAFLWYVDSPENPELGLVRDLGKARDLIDEYARLSPPQAFELIEITRGDVQPELHGKLLGYDVTELCHHSLLADGLRFDLEKHQHAIEADQGYCRLAPLIRLFQEHFSARLNEHLLLPDKTTAAYCAECAAALIQLYPSVFDMPRESLVVVGLYKA